LAPLPGLLASAGAADVRFDVMVGRNGLAGAERVAGAATIVSLLQAGGALSLAETIPARGQRLYALVDRALLGDDLSARLVEAEEAIYRRPEDPMVAWDAEELREAFAAAGLRDLRLEVVSLSQDYLVTDAVLDRWFSPAPDGQRASYVQHLSRTLGSEEVAAVEHLYRSSLRGQTCAWTTTIAFLAGRRG